MSFCNIIYDMSDYHILSIIYDHLSRYMMFLNSRCIFNASYQWTLAINALEFSNRFPRPIVDGKTQFRVLMVESPVLLIKSRYLLLQIHTSETRSHSFLEKHQFWKSRDYFGQIHSSFHSTCIFFWFFIPTFWVKNGPKSQALICRTCSPAP